MTELKALSGHARGNAHRCPVVAEPRIGMIRVVCRANYTVSADYSLNMQVGEMVTAGGIVIARKRSHDEAVEGQRYGKNH